MSRVTDGSEVGRFRSWRPYVVVAQGTVYCWLGRGCSARDVERVEKRAAGLGLGPLPRVRECEGHESAAFLSLWRPCLEVVGSKEEEKAAAGRKGPFWRLLHVKGRSRRACAVREVPLSRGSLNSGDCFVLDGSRAGGGGDGKKRVVVVWNGRASRRAERAVALEVALAVRERCEDEADVEVQVLGEEDGALALADGFWAGIPEGRGPVRGEAEGGEDADVVAGALDAGTLYRVSDGGSAAGGGGGDGKARCTLVRKAGGAGGPLRRDELDGGDCFVLDCGSEIFAWIGGGAAAGEAKEALAAADRFLKEGGRPQWTRVTRVVEGAETPAFKGMFRWPAAPGDADAREGGEGEPPGTPWTRYAHSYMDVYRATSGGSRQLGEWEQGMFYSGESYVVLFTFAKEAGGDEAHVAYCWHGSDSDRSSRGAASALAEALCVEGSLPGLPAHIRVVQGAEPAHFLDLFAGHMVVRAGLHPDGQGGQAQPAKKKAARAKDAKPELYRVTYGRGADQVPRCSASLLNSGECFVVAGFPPEASTVWCGRHAGAEARRAARACAERIGALTLAGGDGAAAAVKVIDEGRENVYFWEALGGKVAYAEGTPRRGGPGRGGAGGGGPRLFCVASGFRAGEPFAVEEVPGYAQEDLVGSDVMLLDAGGEVFVWVGKGASDGARGLAQAAATRYLRRAAKMDGRSPESVAVTVVHQGREPPMFKMHFSAWDPAFVDPLDAYAELSRALSPALTPGFWNSTHKGAAGKAPSVEGRLSLGRDDLSALGLEFDADDGETSPPSGGAAEVARTLKVYSEGADDDGGGSGGAGTPSWCYLAALVAVILVVAGGLSTYFFWREEALAPLGLLPEDGASSSSPAASNTFRPTSRDSLVAAIEGCVTASGATRATWTGLGCVHRASGAALPDWSVGGVSDLSEVFSGYTSFAGNVSAWDVSGATSMSSMFRGAAAFNGDLSAWDVRAVQNLRGMFWEASAYAQDLGAWDVSGARSMYGMFADATAFDGDVETWATGGVTDMFGMFAGARTFNGDLSSWDVGAVTSMGSMFFNAVRFNQNLGAWDVTKVENMAYMFTNAVAFDNAGDASITAWDDGAAVASAGMFTNATAWHAAFTCTGGSDSKPSECALANP